MYEPIPGNLMFQSLKEKDTIILAANVRVTPGVARGIMRAAKDMDASVIFEIARSECNLQGGYIGLKPQDYAEHIKKAAMEVGFDMWALHADHITVKKGTPEEISDTKKLIDAQISSGYTSFAIDASHLFDFKGGDLREELSMNINATTELAKYIIDKMEGREFGLEVEVGEIGREDSNGKVVTSPEEAVTFIRALNDNGIFPDVIAIANGSTHGNVYDEYGNPIEQVSIDIPRTKAVADALRKNNMNVRIAQHGITGTPRELIKTVFPRGDILKGNVATFWQNIVMDTIKICAPELYSEIFKWTIDTYGPKSPGKRDIEVFGKNAKNAIAKFHERIYSLDDEIIKTFEALAYAEARIFFDVFNATGTASMVRKYISDRQ